MNVLALTIMLSLCLAGIFVVFFIYELKKPRRRGIEHQALMPLEEDNFKTEPKSTHKS
ncbi:MAG: hypothetical protein AB8F34_03120 [Akkermansiaceae bacterium]